MPHPLYPGQTLTLALNEVADVATGALTDEQIEGKLEEEAGKHGLFQCDVAANAMAGILRKHNRNGEIIILTWVGGRDYVISDSNPLAVSAGMISRNAMHQGVSFNGIVRCNVHPTGLPEAQWIADFMATGRKIITRIPI